VGDAQTHFSPGLVAGGELLRRLLRHRHSVDAEQQTQGCIVAASEVSQHLGDTTRAVRLVTRAGAHQLGERSDRRLVGRVYDLDRGLDGVAGQPAAREAYDGS
jgi:hypothetical protein